MGRIVETDHEKRADICCFAASSFGQEPCSRGEKEERANALLVAAMYDAFPYLLQCADENEELEEKNGVLAAKVAELEETVKNILACALSCGMKDPTKIPF